MFRSRKRPSEATELQWLETEHDLDTVLPELRVMESRALAHDHWAARLTLPEYVPVLVGIELHAWTCEAMCGFLRVVHTKRHQSATWIPDSNTVKRMDARTLEAQAEYLNGLGLASRLANAPREATTAEVILTRLGADDFDELEVEAEAFEEPWRQLKAGLPGPHPTRDERIAEVIIEMKEAFGITTL